MEGQKSRDRFPGGLPTVGEQAAIVAARAAFVGLSSRRRLPDVLEMRRLSRRNGTREMTVIAVDVEPRSTDADRLEPSA